MSFVNSNLSITANVFPKAGHGNRTGIELYTLSDTAFFQALATSDYNSIKPREPIRIKILLQFIWRAGFLLLQQDVVRNWKNAVSV